MTLHRSLDSRFTIASDGRHSYARHALEIIRSRDARILVAEELATGQLVGYVMGEILTRPAVSIPGAYGFISDISVTEAWRHRGVGTELFQELRRWFVDRKVRAVELYVADVNPVSMAFWTEMGLTPFLRLMHVDL